MLIYEGNLHKKTISELWAEKITFPPKPDRQTYTYTDGRTDICFYRVALLILIKSALAPNAPIKIKSAIKFSF